MPILLADVFQAPRIGPGRQQRLNKYVLSDAVFVPRVADGVWTGRALPVSRK